MIRACGCFRCCGGSHLSGGLWLTFHFADENRGRIFKTAVAVVMGLAIPLMHYTGMAAVSYMPAETARICRTRSTFPYWQTPP